MRPESQEYDEDINDIYDHNGLLVTRDPKTGQCWALSPRDYQGEIDLSNLKSLGKFRLVY